MDIARDVEFVGIPSSPSLAGDYNKLKLHEEEDSSQYDMIIASRIYPDDDQWEENHEQLDEDSEEQESNDSDRRDNNREGSCIKARLRGRGRPKILRTGKRGRPKKQYHTVNCAEETEEIAYNAETSLEEALHAPHAEKWLQAFASEMTSIIKNKTWEIIEKPTDYKVVGSRVVLRDKYRPDGTLDGNLAW